MKDLLNLNPAYLNKDPNTKLTNYIKILRMDSQTPHKQSCTIYFFPLDKPDILDTPKTAYQYSPHA